MNTLIAVGVLAIAIATPVQEGPKVYLSSSSKGNKWGAMRDQSQEMAKDFAKNCPEVQVTANPEEADYRIVLNHIEVGWSWDNQVAVGDMFGNLLLTTEKNSINKGVKGACALIRADWSNTANSQQRLVDGINTRIRKDGVVGYAEVLGDKLTVHSERGTAMRFHMILASEREILYLRRAGIATYAYTNDADQNFLYDVKSGQIVSPAGQQAGEASDPAARLSAGTPQSVPLSSDVSASSQAKQQNGDARPQQ